MNSAQPYNAPIPRSFPCYFKKFIYRLTHGQQRCDDERGSTLDIWDEAEKNLSALALCSNNCVIY